MYSEDKQMFSEYAALVEQEKAIKEKLAELKNHIVGFMQEKDVSKLETEVGVFQMRGRAVWKYSQQVKEFEKQLKEAKQQEEGNGVATSTISEYLTFKA